MTVTLHIDDIGRKEIQKEHYGDKDWKRSYDRRTHVEGWFGNAKDPSKENVSRSGSRGDCRGLRLLYVSVAAAVVNVRLLRRWHEQHGQDTPLTGIDPVLTEPEPDTSVRVIPTELLEAA
jgi:hypothetical protein